MTNLVFCLGGFFISMLVTRLVKHGSGRLKLVHEPNERSSHDSVVPHGGGIGIVTAFLALMAVSPIFYTVPTDVYTLFLLGGLLMAGVSLLDDLRGVSSTIRLAVHLIAAALAVAVACAGLFDHEPIATRILLYVFTVVLLGWWINLFNFMDGIDSIAGIEGISLLMGLQVLSAFHYPALGAFMESWYVVSVFLLLTCIAGFMIFNWPPATIFMGDVGSAFLGFVIGAFALLGWSMQIAPVWSWLILAGAFFVDATSTLLRRILTGEKWWQAHNSHAYQCVSRYLASFRTNRHEGRTFAHRVMASGVGVINLLWLLPLAVLAQSYPEWGVACLVLAWLPLVIFVAKWSRSNYLTG